MPRPTAFLPTLTPLRSWSPMTPATSQRRPLRHTSSHSPPRQRTTPRMLGPFFPDFADSNLMKSDIVRREMADLERDYTRLAELGRRYETFDRQGKIMYVDSALDVVDRYAVFITRLRLSEEFSAQMFLKQYQLKLQEFGLTIETLMTNTRESLEMMKAEADKL